MTIKSILVNFDVGAFSPANQEPSRDGVLQELSRRWCRPASGHSSVACAGAAAPEKLRASPSSTPVDLKFKARIVA